MSLCLVVLGGLAGCETDAWMFDPSVIGYWERTPTKVPILERVGAIEGPEDEFVEVEEVQPEDLQPLVEAYRAGPGDILEVRIWDLPVANQQGIFQVQIDPRGFGDVPPVGQLYLNDLTADEIKERIAEAAEELVTDPEVEVLYLSRRQSLYSIFGQVASAGAFQITEPDFRLLEAITLAGGMSESIPYVYIIRQVTLSPEDLNVPAPSDDGEGGEGDQPTSDELIDLIERLAEPEGESGSGDGGDGGDGGGGLAVMGDRGVGGVARRRQPEEAGEEAIIDLIEDQDAPSRREQPGDAAGESLPETGEAGAWVFVNGEWVRVQAAVPSGPPGDEDAAERLVTQRVVRVPADRLLAGDARYNPVVRPGDVIRVPGPEQGNVYVAGEVARPGVYGLPGLGRLTLMRAVVAAGGLTPTAIPSRVDLTRRTGPEEQATIRLSLRAIFEGSQPDIFLKPDDQINVGTNFFAFPAAVIRNGFRMTYGFAFLLDRNFGNDVFGPPPVNRGDSFF